MERREDEKKQEVREKQEEEKRKIDIVESFINSAEGGMESRRDLQNPEDISSGSENTEELLAGAQIACEVIELLVEGYASQYDDL